MIFRASTSSLECCCLIDNDEFLSGSDDGNIELWGIQKKKPVYIVKNAHALLTDFKGFGQKDNGSISNGHLGKCFKLLLLGLDFFFMCIFDTSQFNEMKIFLFVH